MKSVRTVTMAVLALAPVASAPWLGWWTLVPLVFAAGLFHLARHKVFEANRPERLVVRIALAAVAATMLIGGTAQAATVTVGSPLTATFAQQLFTENATVANFIVPSPANATSPTDGTVISWSFIGAGGSFTPRVLHSTGGTSYTGSGTGTAVTPTATPPAVSGPFTTRLPIKKGDLFGVNAQKGSNLGGGTTPGATFLYWVAPPLADGAVRRAPRASVVWRAAIGATVRFCKVPKLKRLPRKAARQALAAADCRLGKVTKSRQTRPKEQVLSQSVKANRTIADTAPVDFTVSQK